MKKLLALLGALGISVSASTVVVACGQNNSVERFSIAKVISDQIFMDLLNDEDNNFSKSKAKVLDLIMKNPDILLKRVQDLTSRLSNEHFKNQINKNLKLNLQENKYQEELDEITSDLARNQFYLQYTNNKLTNPATSMDETLHISGNTNGRLNPKNLLVNDKITKDENKYFIYVRDTKEGDTWSRWQYRHEISREESKEDYPKYKLPTIENLQNNEFIVLKSSEEKPLGFSVTISDADLDDQNNWCLVDDKGEIKDDGYIYSKDGKTVKMDGKTALEYRFQAYFKNQIFNEFFSKNKETKTNIFESLLTMTYLDTNFYNISRNQKTQTQEDAFLNIGSNLAQFTQSWNKQSGYNSKLKMIWSFTLKREQMTKAWETINPYLKSDQTLKNNSRQSLKKIYDKLNLALKDAGGNISKLGSDPFFNLGGYNGLVKVDAENNVTSVDGNFMINDAAKTKIAKAKGPSILTADGRSTGFDSEISGEYDFVFVLPIYLIDLLNDRTIDLSNESTIQETNFDNGESTTAFVTPNDVSADGTANKLYSGYSKAMDGVSPIDESKKIEINSNIKNTNDFWIYVDGVPYTVSDFNRLFTKNVPNNSNIWNNNDWKTLDNGQTVDGLQFRLKNTIETDGNRTIGNISINQKVKVGSSTIYKKPQDDKGFKFEEIDGGLYVTANDQNLVGKVVKFDEGQENEFHLSFDDGTKDGVYTIQGTLNDGSDKQGKTYSYRVNMGANGSQPNGYIKDGGFDFYKNNTVSSLDIATLSTERKSSLLREIEFITSKESGVADTAAGAIYPLFLTNDQILYQPLYEILKKYLIDEDGGTSD